MNLHLLEVDLRAAGFVVEHGSDLHPGLLVRLSPADRKLLGRVSPEGRWSPCLGPLRLPQLFEVLDLHGVTR